MKLLQDLITGIQNNAFSQKSVIQSVRIHNNFVFCMFCHHCPLPLLCCGSVGPLAMPPLYKVLQSVLLSITATFEVHGKNESISDKDESCYLFGSDYGCYMDDTIQSIPNTSPAFLKSALAVIIFPILAKAQIIDPLSLIRSVLCPNLSRPFTICCN